MSRAIYDVVIVGGGMVGAACAAALHQRLPELKLAMIDESESCRCLDIEQADVRVSAISIASERLFRNIGIWDSIRSTRAQVYDRMHVWDTTGHGEIEFDAAQLGVGNLGHIIENRVIQHFLWQYLADAGIELICPAKLSSIELTEQWSSLKMTDDRRIRSQLIVAADGAQSLLRQLAEISVERKDYHQMGVVATLSSEIVQDRTAFQWFSPQGILGFLPINNGGYSMVWSTANSNARRLLELDNHSFCEELTLQTEQTLGQVHLASNRAAFPLCMQKANTYSAQRLVLIGDAAHSVHPLAGQGVNMGLLDVVALVDELNRAIDKGRRFSSARVLRAYERRRKGENELMADAFDSLKYLFGSSRPAFEWARNTGLSLVNGATPVKLFLAKQALFGAV